jgi:PAS domain S-box-containing protein
MSRSAQDFEDLAESIPHIVWMSAADGATDYFNRHGTDYTGMPASANYGWGWLDLVHPGDAPGAQRAWQEATQTKTPYQLSYRIRRGDGEYRWHAFRALPIRSPDGEVERWIGTATDIDGAVRMADRLADIGRQTTELLSLLGTLQAPAESFGYVERAIRALRTNASLVLDESIPAQARARSGDNPADDEMRGAMLTPGEREVVRLVALGYTNREAANKLAVSLRTVESHRARAIKKLGVRSRADVVRFAYRSGLVDWS